MPDQIWNLTPAELIEIVEARMDTRMADWRFFDTLNGMISALYASAHGVTAATPRDFMITPRETSENTNEEGWVTADTPDKIEKVLEIITAAGLAQKVDRHV